MATLFIRRNALSILVKVLLDHLGEFIPMPRHSGGDVYAGVPNKNHSLMAYEPNTMDRCCFLFRLLLPCMRMLFDSCSKLLFFL